MFVSVERNHGTSGGIKPTRWIGSFQILDIPDLDLSPIAWTLEREELPGVVGIKTSFTRLGSHRVLQSSIHLSGSSIDHSDILILTVHTDISPLWSPNNVA
jgi:hypothetical protein